jgi:hypothetical protein
MSEFDLIRQLHERINGADGSDPSACVVGIGDDCAVLEIPQDRQVVVTTDTLVEGVHFLTTTDAQSLGHKALAVNLSDLASMGAQPAWFFLALTLPAPDLSWLESFALGMGELARSAGIVLAGGDTTSGPLSITITAIGLVEPGMALTRDGQAPKAVLRLNALNPACSSGGSSGGWLPPVSTSRTGWLLIWVISWRHRLPALKSMLISFPVPPSWPGFPWSNGGSCRLPVATTTNCVLPSPGTGAKNWTELLKNALAR